VTKIIEIIVQPDGQTRVETKGFTGSTCRDASRFIQEALGKTSGEQLTGEFYQTHAAQQNAQQRT
jgi:hypothetical protein